MRNQSGPVRPVMVAGGAGFVGSHLCDRLIEQGLTVVCVDNLSTGDLRNIEHLLDEPRFRFLKHDVIEPLHVDVAAIFNLACPASPVHYQTDPIRTTITSVYGANNLLQLARECNASYLQASTSEVYGDPLVHPQTEEYWGNVNPNGLRSCYDEGKRCAESLCFDYKRKFGVDVRVVRIFNTYGPRMQVNDGRVVSNFIVQALRGEPLTIFGTGSQTRSFCYVDDLVDGLMRFMQAPADIPSPINIGNPREFTMRELAERVLRLTGSRSKLVFMPLPADDPTQRKPVIERATGYLGWAPHVQLEEGLQRTIDYFDSLLSGDETAASSELKRIPIRDVDASAIVEVAGRTNGLGAHRVAP